MSENLRLSYPKSTTITCKAFYDNGAGSLSKRGTDVVLTEDTTYVYSGAADAGWVAGDMLVYFDATIPVDAEEFLPTGLSGATSGGGVISAGYLGNYKLGETIYFMWGVTSTATLGTVLVYKNTTTPGSAAGVDNNLLSGSTVMYICSIDTSADAFYAAKRDYNVVVEDITIDGVTSDAVIATFSIDNREVGKEQVVYEK